jgi:hypothetical protein
MSRHRLSQLTKLGPQRTAVATSACAGAFVPCPLGLRPRTPEHVQLWQHLFERAYREAQRVVKPSILERLQAATVN